eukprot:TRINITY_DN2840_c0_g1_i1.p2 TRINITY_DN2840_c0_g1~~TRINITY_DN2840_c0_g1_i1.p2  ORF type:complete len:260 (+),score=58.07 TRINITY_DN2840_c0_g1_i1:839-1618(+)
MTNTLLALCSCCFTTFMLSRLMRGENKFCMVDIQNATLAGGVAMGSAADMILGPGGAVGLGMVASLVSVFGFTVLQPYLETHTRIRDTCGVHNLHGMPGILGGLASAFGALYGTQHWTDYGATTAASYFKHGGRQIGMQFAAMAVSLGLAIAGGLLTGFIVRLLTNSPKRLFSDGEFWEVPHDFEDTSLYTVTPGLHDDGTAVPHGPTHDDITPNADEVEMVPLASKVDATTPVQQPLDAEVKDQTATGTVATTHIVPE